MPIEGAINVKPYSVGPIGPVAADPLIAQDFSYASAIYDQVGITVNDLGASSIVQADGNNDGNWTAAEFHATLNNLGRVGLPAGTIVTYYVPSYPGPLAQTWSDEDVQGAVLNPGIIANNVGRNPDTIAHEFGHMLLNSWRWKPTEDETPPDNGIHALNVNNLMAPGTSRNTPTVLGQVWPAGAFDQIPNTVGYLNGNPTAIVPQITAMYTLNSEVAITGRDTFGVGMGIVDGLGGGPTVASGPILWAGPGAVTDPLRGVTFDIAESARKAGPGHQEEFTFYYHAHTPLAPLTLLQLAVADVDSLGLGYAGVVLGSVGIDVYTDILNDVGKVTLKLGTDYTFAGVVDGVGDDLDHFGVTIGGGVLLGVNDIAVHFNLQVIPEPTSWLLAVTGGVGIALALRRRRPAGRSTARSTTA